jgi:hypothetical protein
MDLATRQKIIDKIRDSSRASVEKAAEYDFGSDELFERYRQMSINCIESMNDERQVFLKTRETGEVELVEVDVNQYLRLFDPIEIDDD